ncbi:MAG: EAL domain-containing response regulator [Alphaproteobacteria bacterium]|nr:EAL domain-containing response regulator [Alphaproteobacteria bacterium]
MNSASLHFLIVDDDDFLRMATKAILRNFTDTPILEAANGQQALDVLQAQASSPVDVVFCDLSMPGMDGLEFLRHLGEHKTDVSVVIVSGHDDALMAAVEKMAQAYGIFLLGTVQKPLSRERVADLVTRQKEKKPRSRLSVASAAPEFSLNEILHGLRQQEFVPYFQPQVDFRTGRITGAEALARWLHPERGVIAPYAFIDTLEKSGQIDVLTFCILAQAAAAACRLRQGGQEIGVSVNLSLVSLGVPQLAERILETVRAAGAEPQQIALEITETAAMTDLGHSLENLARLRMQGFVLSIDDYGTGFSNIQQITRIAFQELKIDQTFVKASAADQGQRIIVRSSIDMAHQLKMTCVAEGVETRQNWDDLKDMGCDTAQGYFIAKPMAAEAFHVFCDAHTQGWSPSPAA